MLHKVYGASFFSGVITALFLSSCGGDVRKECIESDIRSDGAVVSKHVVQKRQKALSIPAVESYPPHNSTSTCITLGESVTFTCSASVGHEDNKALYWMLVATNRTTLVGTTGDAVEVFEFNDGYQRILRSTLTIFPELADNNTIALCHTVDKNANGSDVTCEGDDICKKSKTIIIRDQRYDVCKSHTSASLTDTKYVKPNEKVSIRCDASIASLPSDYTRISKVALGRTLRGQVSQRLVTVTPGVDDPTDFQTTSGRKWEIFRDEQGVNVTLVIYDTILADAGLYYCTVEYYSGTSKMSSTRCQLLDILIVPKTPVLQVNFSRLISGDFKVKAACSAYVGRNGKLSWHLKSEESTVIWPLYGHGWPKSIRLSYGMAFVHLVNDSITEGTHITSSLVLSRMSVANLSNFKLSCTSQDIKDGDDDDADLWTTTGLRPPSKASVRLKHNRLNPKALKTESDADYILPLIVVVVILGVFTICIAVCATRNICFSSGDSGTRQSIIPIQKEFLDPQPDESVEPTGEQESEGINEHVDGSTWV